MYIVHASAPEDACRITCVTKCMYMCMYMYIYMYAHVHCNMCMNLQCSCMYIYMYMLMYVCEYKVYTFIFWEFAGCLEPSAVIRMCRTYVYIHHMRLHYAYSVTVHHERVSTCVCGPIS